MPTIATLARPTPLTGQALAAAQGKQQERASTWQRSGRGVERFASTTPAASASALTVASFTLALAPGANPIRVKLLLGQVGSVVWH